MIRGGIGSNHELVHVVLQNLGPGRENGVMQPSILIKLYANKQFHIFYGFKTTFQQDNALAQTA